MAQDNILENLNQNQKEAVLHENGPCLVVAGAGTGKTSVITRRIVYLINERGVAPESIIALTYTEKAAGEMQERLDELLDYGTFVTTSTFHSFCNELIRRHAFRLGINPEARLITEADQIAVLREHLARLPLHYYQPAYNPSPLLKKIAGYIEQAKENQLTPAQLLTHAEKAEKEAIDEASSELAAQYLELARCYEVVEQLYKELNVLTYADLLRYARDILHDSPLALQEEQVRFQHILIDEYQDTNTIQAEIAYLIAGESANLFVVGDDDQSIYRFRGANIKNILGFKEQFPKAKVITLTQNYRSTQAILDAAYTLIQYNNPHRLEVRLNISKKLQSAHGKGEVPTYLHFSSGTHEAEGIASSIKKLIDQEGFAPTDIAVIARSHNQLDPFEEELINLEIPINRVKEGNFFQEPSVIQALAYLRFLSDPHNSENLFRLLTGAPFEVSGEDVAEHNITSKKRHISLWDCLHTSDVKLTQALEEAVGFYSNALHQQAALPPTLALRDYLYDSKWQANLIEAAEEQAAIHLTSLYHQARTFELLHQPTTILSFVDQCDRLIASGEDFTVQSELTDPAPGVTLITAHSSKGLEFKAVFTVNMVIRRFPLIMNTSDLQLPSALITPLQDNILYEEERRLAYVAFTRAKEHLYISNAAHYGTNKTSSKPSPFITEALPLTQAPDLADQPLRGVVLAPNLNLEKQALAFPHQFSASALESFEDNPAVYYEQYVLQIIPEDVIAMNFGNAVHNTLRDVFNARREKVVPDLDAIFARYWVGEGYDTQGGRDKDRAECLEIITHHLKSLADDFFPAYIEESLTLQLSNGVRITGKVDRIDRNEDTSLSIIDYKTGKKDAKESDVQGNLPLALYAAALLQQKKKVRDISLFYLRTKSTPQLVLTQDFVITQIERTKALVERMREAYASRHFPDSGKRYGRSHVR